MTEKTHYRKAFNSPYLSAADIVEPVILTVSRVLLESDKTKKTKGIFNTAYFVEKQIRQGEKLKPMILNATNSKMMAHITGSSFIEEWINVRITVSVDPNVRFGGDIVEGLRIREPDQAPVIKAKEVLNEVRFSAALGAVIKGTFEKQRLLDQYDLTDDQVNRVNSIETKAGDDNVNPSEQPIQDNDGTQNEG